MATQLKHKDHLLQVFKFATIIHILCLITNLIIHPYVPVYDVINTIIEYSNLMSIICISLVISVKTIQFFKIHHKNFISHHKIMGLIAEFFITSIMVIIIFFNQEITDEFVLFVATLSKKSHDHKIIILVALLLLIFCMELYSAHEINRKSMKEKSIKEKVFFDLISLILKLFIISGSAIGFIHPALHFFNSTQIQQLNKVIFHFTTIDFFVYIHTIIMTILGLWTIIGIYYIYKLYQNKRR